MLREYLIKGCAINRERMRQLGQTVEVMKRIANSLDVVQVLDVVNAYSTALDLLDGYDHQTIEKPKTKGRSVELTYEECRRFIDSMKFAADSKNHGFSDGNKRIAAGLFLYFLKRNRLLLRRNGTKRIADHTLVALTVMIAESKPQEKELMVNLVMTFLK